jgi:hypothetical protein
MNNVTEFSSLPERTCPYDVISRINKFSITVSSLYFGCEKQGRVLIFQHLAPGLKFVWCWYIDIQRQKVPL